MEFFKSRPNIDFLGKKYIAIVFSAFLIAMSVYVWIAKGNSKFGVDFAGGTEVSVLFEKPIEASAVRSIVEQAGAKDSTVQALGKSSQEFSIRIPGGQGSETGKNIRVTLQGIADNKATVQKEDYVGPVIGDEIRRNGWIAFFLSNIAILIYIAFRFEWRFGVGAVVALLHDGIVTTGIYLLTGRDINAAFLAAILTITGYSVNDTIVIYDRIRENLMIWYKGKKPVKPNKDKPVSERDITELTFEELMNRSINETLGRTLLTAVTVTSVVLVLWLFGGGVVSDLSFVLFIGCIVGSYSTMYIASPIVLALEGKGADKRE